MFSEIFQPPNDILMQSPSDFDEQALVLLIQDASSGHSRYRALLRRKLPSDCRSAFQKLSAVKARQLQQLQRICYLLTGDTLAVSSANTEPSRYILKELHTCASAERQSYRHLMYTASHTDDPELRSLCRSLAEEDMNCCRILSSIVSKFI